MTNITSSKAKCGRMQYMGHEKAEKIAKEAGVVKEVDADNVQRGHGKDAV